jgi:LssY C-terminus
MVDRERALCLRLDIRRFRMLKEPPSFSELCGGSMVLRRIHLKWGVALAGLPAAVGLYGFLAYVVLPLTWRHYEHQRALAGVTMLTHTAAGIPGDSINVGLVGSKEDVLCAMNAAASYPADPITLRSSIEIVGSVLLRRPYPDAPVSHLYYQDRREDLAFEKPVQPAPSRSALASARPRTGGASGLAR